MTAENKKEGAKPTSGKEKFPGYPKYPDEEDIYQRGREASETPEGKEDTTAGAKDSLAAGLDVPGSELDDRDEAIGEEDEENNYYSLGGDLHEDLEEDDNR